MVSFAGAAFVAWKLFTSNCAPTCGSTRGRYGPETGGRGYENVQALFAMADGGIGGRGLGLGTPNKIPEARTTSIFAAIGEEMGLIGATAVLIAFVLMIGAGLRIATRAERPFEKLLATGLSTIIGVQAFIIIGGVVRVIPG